jgi:hypothetical protein
VLHQAGQQLTDQGQGFAAGYIERAAGGVEQAAGYLREHEVQELVADVEGFARRQPAWFVAGAFALGLLGARFLKSSRQAMAHDGGGSGQWDGAAYQGGSSAYGTGAPASAFSTPYPSSTPVYPYSTQGALTTYGAQAPYAGGQAGQMAQGSPATGAAGSGTGMGRADDSSPVR